MDPVSILSVVSAIITFIDFSWSLVTGATEVYQNPLGTIDNNAYIKVAKQLQVVSANLKTDFPGDSGPEKHIREIADACFEESKTLIGLLEKFRARQKKYWFFLSLKKSWQMWKTSGDVKKSKDRLREYQSQIMLHFMLMLQDESSQMTKHLRSVEETCKHLMIEFPKQFDTFRDELIRVSKEYVQFDAVLTTRTLALIRDIQEKNNEISAQNYILQKLNFKDRCLRHEQIHTANEDTCGWIFGYDLPGHSNSLHSTVTENVTIRQYEYEKGVLEQHRKEASHEFLSWLNHGHNILHVSGKAGSGKSTLMKFIASHEKSREELQKWAGEKTLIIGKFYFWNPGTTLQMSLGGLYRSLLFAILSRCPEMIKLIFPCEWEKLYRDIPETERNIGGPIPRTLAEFLMNSNRRHHEYKYLFEQEFSSEPNLERAFEAFIRKSRHSHYRVCFFIDGLDECDGNRLVHEELAQKIKYWTEGGNVKVCASSRPYKEFHDVLGSSEIPRLHLHLLNRFDIWTYCVNRFSHDREAKKMKQSYMSIINDITENSEGVFLWARLVVDIILLALRQGDPYHILQEKLAEIPKELNLLYSKLREPIERSKLNKEMSNKMLLLALRNPTNEDLDAIVFSWLDRWGNDGIEDPDFPKINTYFPYDEMEYTEKIENVEKKMDGLTRGFLEFSPTNRKRESFLQPWFNRTIQFSHKTARDFLLQHEGVMSNFEEPFPRFNSSYPYGRILLAQLIHGFRAILTGDNSNTINFLNYLERLFPEHINDIICHKIQVEIQRLWPWFLFSLKTYHPDATLGFEFYSNFVNASIQLPRVSEAYDPAMLLAALGRKDWVSAAKHIISDEILDHPIRIEASTGRKYSFSWPLWTIAFIFIINYQFSNHDYANNDVDRIRHTLRKHGDESANSFRFEIFCLQNYDKKGNCLDVEVQWDVLANVLELAGKLARDEPVAFTSKEDIGMTHEYGNEALRHVVQPGRGNAAIIFLSALWKDEHLDFSSYIIPGKNIVFDYNMRD
ncbi:uncharacterized protein GGS22DRAFT_179582 [Annulohypoxylon maeteangense]|uniref:uncharacterized protein n=1 Tax=Annulohypoxylon maeteangense TaxID=1927788 RepID=UPI002008242E|nr:uncharacterized protein GGS22DRAFT_179582 [Annulohypoxylon maeteangense]KAI0885896.1 hypothetical protein GGS22DRAFT_179582 [Annulohypoxylon maeteangense]